MMWMSFVAALLVQQPAATVQDVKWLTGCWEYSTASRNVTEYWLAPRGGTMLGVSQTVSAGATVEYEFIVLRAGAKGLEYVAKPSGQAEAVFTSTSISPDEVIFENPAHDFPTRIAYRRTAEGLVATVGGTRNGKARSIEFRYTPGECGR